MGPTLRAPAVLTAICLIILSACSTGPDEASFGTPVAGPVDASELNGSFVLDVEESDADTARWAEVWGPDGLLADAVGDLNDTFLLPEDVTVLLVDDGEGAGPHYRPDERTVVMPADFADDVAAPLAVLELADDEIEAVVALNTLFVLLHETGHALIDVLELPITAREEDSADAFAVVMMTMADQDDTEGDEKAFGAVPLAASLWFDSVSIDFEPDESDYWDEHSLAPQRAATIACLTYGSDPEEYDDLLDTLDEDRAERCPGEYAQVARGWMTLLDPYLID